MMRTLVMSCVRSPLCSAHTHAYTTAAVLDNSPSHPRIHVKVKSEGVCFCFNLHPFRAFLFVSTPHGKNNNNNNKKYINIIGHRFDSEIDVFSADVFYIVFLAHILSTVCGDDVRHEALLASSSSR